MDFKTVRLWRDAFASREEEPKVDRARARLREAFTRLHERAELLAGEIPQDLPEFTVHDISHLDALWETADEVAGPNISLTPPEAFLLGGGILLHDLGMSLAAYPGGAEELKRTVVWRDAVARLLRRDLGRWPTTQEIQNPSTAQTSEAIREALRLMHADQAARLGAVSWKGASGTQYHLIDDPDLRGELGALIGSIAQSHNWPTARLKGEFSEMIGAPGDCPSSWTMDPLKVACLLRLADACHLDARRAPGFLQALRQPRGVSEAHWTFQRKLGRPRLESEWLVFTSSSKFSEAEASAWWLCSEALHMVDRELRQVDALLLGAHRPRFAARGVAGIENPERMVELIRTEGWVPVDTRVRVRDVPLIVERFGGRQLYGDNPDVPLRELIQNACDAVQARRLLEEQAEDWGDVIVRMGQDEEGAWVEVEDSGLGMSQALLTGPLLDFGTSYWGSELAREECPGLWSRGFQPTGRFGIGFFSVFMWGDHIRVCTRRSEDGQKETRVLEFKQGVGSPPLLRMARADERLRDAGTRVRVWPRVSLHERGNVLYPDGPLNPGPHTLWEYLKRSYPAPNANLYAEEQPEPRRIVRKASGWMHMDGVSLLEDLSTDWYGVVEPSVMEKMGRNLRPLKTSTGNVVGRACIDVQRKTSSCDDMLLGRLSVGGHFSGFARSMAGILMASPSTVARHSALPDVDPESLAKWASEQAKLWGQESLEEEDKHWVAAVVRHHGGDVGSLPVALSAWGWLSVADIAMRQWPSSLVLLDPTGIQSSSGYVGFGYEVLELHRRNELVMHPSLLLVRTENPLAADAWWSEWSRAAKNCQPSTSEWAESVSPPAYSLVPVIVGALARSWSIELEHVSVHPFASSVNEDLKEVLSCRDGRSLFLSSGGQHCRIVTRRGNGT